MSHLTKKWRRSSRIIPVVFAIVGFVAINILFAITTFPILPWKTVETFHGTGSMDTRGFAAPAHWRITWSCDPSSSPLHSYNVIVNIKYPAGKTEFGAVNTFCKNTNRSGMSDEYQAGEVYLSVISEGSWTIKIQELP